MSGEGKSLETVLAGAERALVLGIGGGGDVVGALASARLCESFGVEFILGGVSWERLPVDPKPGPRPLTEITDIKALHRWVGLANKQTRAVSGVVFAEAHVAGFLGRDTLLIDPGGGPAAVADGLATAAEALSAQLIVLVDVGGDVLANGTETGLGSPLCDAVMLAASQHLPDGIESMGAIFGPGCDGELTHREVLARLTTVASAGGLLGAWGITPAVRDELEEVIQIVPTEASAQAVRCARGEIGEATIRAGSRSLYLSPLGALTFYFDAGVAFQSAAPLARAVSDSDSLASANARLNDLGLITELDYELSGTNH